MRWIASTPCRPLSRWPICKGFAPAARKLGLSPSAVTRLIAALEDRLGARLLQRTTRSVTLTDVGARYLERARRILADVEEAEGCRRGRAHPAERAAGGLGAGRIRAAARQPGDVGLSEALSARSQRELRLSDRMINLVEDGVDLAVRIGHLADSTLVARHVGDMRRIVVASPDISSSAASRRRPQRLPRTTRSSSAPHAARRTGALSRMASEVRVDMRAALCPPTAPMPRSSMPSRTAA